MKIGVFDSGAGGKSVADAIAIAFSKAEVIYKDDHDNIPYGNKTPEQLYDLVLPILNTLSNSGCDIIVIACNTVSTTILDKLQLAIKTPLLGVEPLIERAVSITKSGVITVCATPATLKSGRYNSLKRQHAGHNVVLEPDCSQWAYLIENDQIDHFIIKETISDALEQGSDVIVLGCTHYHWIEKDIKQIAGKRAVVLQPEPEIINNIKLALKLPD